MGDMTDLEFRQMIERHGGCISIKPNARSLIIATRLKANKPLIRAIRPQWVLDSIANNRKQSKSKYLLVNQ